MNHDGPRWDFQKPKDFQKQILKLPQSIRPKLTQVMTELSVVLPDMVDKIMYQHA